MERWVVITEAVGYAVSDYGRVKNLETGAILSVGNGEYAVVNLSMGRSYLRRSVHELVLEAFVCNRPSGLLGNHKDLDKRNNHVSNLEWVTPSENIQHAWDNGAMDSAIFRRMEKVGLANDDHFEESLAPLTGKIRYKYISPEERKRRL